MIVILGLIIVVAAVVVGVAGVLGNGGSGHALTHGFSVLGYHVTGSTGTLFLYGIVVGAVAVFGLWLLLAGARRTSRRGRAARRGLKADPAARPPPSPRTATTSSTSARPPARRRRPPRSTARTTATVIPAQTTVSGADCTRSGTGPPPGRTPAPHTSNR